jgi:hypothetical protein
MADHDKVAFFDPVHGNSFRTSALREHSNPAVHLRVFNLDPLIV